MIDAGRLRIGRIWKAVFYFCTLLAIVILITLILSIVNSAFGYVAVQYSTDPADLLAQYFPEHNFDSGESGESGQELQSLSAGDLSFILNAELRRGQLRILNAEAPLNERSREDLLELVGEKILDPRVEESWTLFESLFARQEILDWQREQLPNAWLQFRRWVNLEFLGQDLSNIPERAGLRKPILGSIMVILITIFFAFPLGVGTAIYLEEFAPDTRLNRLIQVNIYNLSGVPSIVYGLLGLAVFVRILEPITSGSAFGLGDGSVANGRTILSAGLTLGLLILPIIVINAQEAIRAVPVSLRQSSLALGATTWQTIWNHVLPASMDRILTGTIIAVSRGMGETAPLVVVGASAFLTQDPTSIFDKFTTLPIMIYRWTAYPQEEFRNLAAAAIIVLLIILFSLNAGAIILRNKYSRKRRLGK